MRYKPKFRKISNSDLLKEFNEHHTDCAGHPNSANLLDINEINDMYIWSFYFCSTQSSHLFTQLDGSMPMTVSEKNHQNWKACQNQKKCMELYKLRKSRSKSI